MIATAPIDHMAILVSSLERSMPYYEKLLPLLGFARADDGLWGNGAFSLKFSEASPEARPYDRYGAGMNHVGFAAPTAALLDEVRAGMAEAGFPVPDVLRLGEADVLFMADPDGIRFEIAHDPRAEERQ